MRLLPSVAIQPNLDLKTRPKQLLGSLPLFIALPIYGDNFTNWGGKEGVCLLTFYIAFTKKFSELEFKYHKLFIT